MMTTRAKMKLAVFTQFAKDLSGLSCCKRAQVACIIFDERMTRVHAIGYNGQPAGIPHFNCTGEPGNCGCIHAEANAIAKLMTTEGGLILYCTTAPCIQCAGLIINTGRIARVFYSTEYRDPRSLELFQLGKVICENLDQLS